MTPPSSPQAITGITDPSKARLVYWSGVEFQHAPADNVGYQPGDADLTSVAGFNTLEWLRGHLHGLTLSNNAGDATNDIDIAAGVATCIDATPFPMVLASAITKRLDANWAVGTNQGGLDTGSIANTTYHVWIIRRSDTGVVDALFSTSATAPTMPANYDQKRRIGSIIRAAGAIVTFFQNGDIFRRTEVTDRNNTAAAASALLTVSVPTGIVVAPLFRYALVVGASVTCITAIGSAAAGSANTTIAVGSTTAADGNDTITAVPPPLCFTNTSAQVYFAQTNSAGTPTNSILNTIGWVDTRGQAS